jgi:hypothetical protein
MSRLLTLERVTPQLMRRSRSNTTFYANKWLGLSPYYYQTPFLDDPYRFKIATFSRQLGKTFAVALKASQKINMFPGHHVGITAQNEKRAYEIYELVRWMQRRNPSLDSLLRPKNDLKSGMTLDLFNKEYQPSRVSYYASGQKGHAIRGTTLNTLLMDEADYIAGEVFTATIPTVSATGGDIYLTSTPGDTIGSMFHSIFQDGWEARQKFEGKMPTLETEEPYTEPVGRRFKFSAYHYDYTHGTTVINPITGLPQIDTLVVNILKEQDYAKYEREYLAKWSEEGSTYFSQQSITSSLVENGFFMERAKYNPTYIAGIDWGRMKDYTAVVIFQVNEARDMLIAVDTLQLRRQSWETIFSKVIEKLTKWRVTSVVHDKKNVGDTLHVWLRRAARNLQFFVRGEKMDTGRKNEMYANAKMGMDMGRIFIQKKNTELVKELRHMLGEDSHMSNVSKIHAPENKFDDHSDAYVLGSSEIKFQLVFDDREADAVPYFDNFYDIYEPDHRDDGYGDVFFEEFEFEDFEFEPSYEF